MSNSEAPKINGFGEHKSVRKESVDEQPTQNGCTKEQMIDSLTNQMSNEISKKDQQVPSRLLSDHTKRLFEEANRAKAQWEGGIAALEHELDLLRRWKWVLNQKKTLPPLGMSRRVLPMQLIQRQKQQRRASTHSFAKKSNNFPSIYVLPKERRLTTKMR